MHNLQEVADNTHLSRGRCLTPGKLLSQAIWAVITFREQQAATSTLRLKIKLRTIDLTSKLSATSSSNVKNHKVAHHTTGSKDRIRNSR